LTTGDLIMLYTDGIYEVSDPHGEEFGQERLLAAVQRRVHLPDQVLFDELLREVQRFSGTKEFQDDVCLVGVEAPGRMGGGDPNFELRI